MKITTIIVFWNRVTTEISCQMDFSQYPFDRYIYLSFNKIALLSPVWAPSQCSSSFPSLAPSRLLKLPFLLLRRSAESLASPTLRTASNAEDREMQGKMNWSSVLRDGSHTRFLPTIWYIRRLGSPEHKGEKVKPAAPSPLCSAARREVEILGSLPRS